MAGRPPGHRAMLRRDLTEGPHECITNRRPAAAEPVPWYLVNAQRDADEPADTPGAHNPATQEGALWLALCRAPDDGADIAELMRLSGMTRATLYRHLAAHADAGRAIQVSRGRWRATTTEDER